MVFRFIYEDVGLYLIFFILNLNIILLNIKINMEINVMFKFGMKRVGCKLVFLWVGLDVIEGMLNLYLYK